MADQAVIRIVRGLLLPAAAILVALGAVFVLALLFQPRPELGKTLRSRRKKHWSREAATAMSLTF